MLLPRLWPPSARKPNPTLSLLREALEDSRLEIQAETAQTLATWAPKPSRLLADELKYKDRQVRSAGGRWCSYAVDRLPFPALSRNSVTLPATLPPRLRQTLGRVAIQHESVIPAVIAAVNDRNESTRSAAVKAIGEIGPDARVRSTCTRCHVEASRSFRALDRHLALGRIGPDARSAAPAIRASLHDPDSLNRSAAAATLNKIETDAAVPQDHRSGLEHEPQK